MQEFRLDELRQLKPVNLENEARVNIRNNAVCLLDRIKAKFGEDQNRLTNFIIFLLNRCFLVAVSTPSQQSAFRVFSVMNSRGLDLQTTDIIKADLIGNIETETAQRSYNDTWETMEEILTRSGFNDLFSHIRMIYAKDKAKKTLLEEFREHVLSTISSSETFIDEIVSPFSEALATIKNCDYQSAGEADKVNANLRWLNKIDNSDWIPPAVLFLSKCLNDEDKVALFFEKLERLAAFLHLTAKDVNKRIKRYAQLISEIESSSLEPSDLIELQLSDEEKGEFKDALKSDIYKMTARRRNYLILRLDSFMSDGAATYDHSTLTIEHVLPQTVDPSSTWATDWPDEDTRLLWVHKLANLVPLNFSRNSQASNYDFDKKKDVYFRGKRRVSSFVLTTQVLNTDGWSPSVVQKRQEQLLETLKENWEL